MRTRENHGARPPPCGSSLLVLLLSLPALAAARDSGRVSSEPLRDVSYAPVRPTSDGGSGHRGPGELSPSEAAECWRLQGSAAWLGGDAGGLRLTEDLQGQSGRASAAAAAARQGRVWVAEASLRIGGDGMSLAADGMALWYTRAPLLAPAGGAAAALTELGGPAGGWQGLAVFVDTYNNAPGRDSHAHPYVSLMLNDGSLVREHGGAGTLSSLHAPAGCSVATLRQVARTGQARVVTLRLGYSAPERRVTLRYFVGASQWEHLGRPEVDWSPCFDVSGVDLELPPGYFWGVSASTGDLTDAHDLLRLAVFGEEGADESEVPAGVREGWAAFDGVLGPQQALSHEAPQGEAPQGEAQAQPHAQGEAAQPHTQGEAAQPHTQGEAAQPHTQGEAAQPHTQGEGDGGGQGQAEGEDEAGAPPHEHADEAPPPHESEPAAPAPEAEAPAHEAEAEPAASAAPEVPPPSPAAEEAPAADATSVPPEPEAAAAAEHAPPPPPPPPEPVAVAAAHAEVDAEALNALLRQSPAFAHLHGRLDDAARSLDEARDAARGAAERLARRADEVLARLRASEGEFESRLARAEAGFAERLAAARAAAEVQARAWRLPFAGLGALALALLGLWARSALGAGGGRGKQRLD